MENVIKPVLYSYWRSSCSWRVRTALNYKGIEYEIRPVNLMKDGGEQNTEEYRSINPAGVVPTLLIDGHYLSESLAILEYLEETHPQPSLYPVDPYEKGQVRAICLQIVANIQPLQNLRVLNYVGEKKGEWGRHWISEGFQALEEVLKKTGGKFAFGDTFSMADLCIVPQVFNANRFRVDMSAFPVIQAINEAALGVEAVKNAHPGTQPDCPESDRIS